MWRWRVDAGYEDHEDTQAASTALFIICTRVTTLHLCYTKNAWLVFSQSDTKKKLKKPERDKRYLSAIHEGTQAASTVSTF